MVWSLYAVGAIGFRVSAFNSISHIHIQHGFLRYELDLLMVGAFGYGLPNGMGALLGSTIVNKVIQTLVCLRRI
jgi:hypothetical protein